MFALEPTVPYGPLPGAMLDTPRSSPGRCMPACWAPGGSDGVVGARSNINVAGKQSSLVALTTPVMARHPIGRLCEEPPSAIAQDRTTARRMRQTVPGYKGGAKCDRCDSRSTWQVPLQGPTVTSAQGRSMKTLTKPASSSTRPAIVHDDSAPRLQSTTTGISEVSSSTPRT